MQSELYHLAKSDFVKGFVMAFIGGVLATLLSLLQNGGVIDWKQVAIIGVTAGLGYVVKNYFSDAEGRVFGKIG